MFVERKDSLHLWSPSQLRLQKRGFGLREGVTAAEGHGGVGERKKKKKK
jgi:hypothetical protein